MATDGEKNTEQTVVTTYVPAYQKEQWEAHAERLDMSQSEFVRTMVQSGRRGFDLDAAANPREPAPRDAAPGGNDLENRVLDLLRAEGHLSWDELVAALTDDIEDRLDEALDRLQADDRVRYRGRQGGYTAVEGADGR